MTQEEINKKLFSAICRGNEKNIRKYIAAGADVNTTAFHWPPLYKAIDMNYEEGVSLLISAGADVDGGAGSGDTPLTTALENKKTALAKCLIKAGADPDKRDMWNRTPLHIAAYNGNVSLMRMLIRAGADIKEKNNSMQTALDILENYHYLKHRKYAGELKELALKVSEKRLKKEDCRANVQTGFEFEI